MHIAFANTKSTAKGDRFDFTTSGTAAPTIGTFILANGAKLNRSFDDMSLDSAHLAFVYRAGTPSERAANVMDPAGDVSLVYTDDDGSSHTLSGNVYHSTKGLNADGFEHVSQTWDANILRQGFEDMKGLGDRDFNDVLLDIEIDITQITDTSPVGSAISISSNDVDGSEVLSVRIDGLPEGAAFSAGTLAADGSWSLQISDLPGLTLLPPAGFSGTIELAVTAIATDGTDSAVTVGTLAVEVVPLADLFQFRDSVGVTQSTQSESLQVGALPAEAPDAGTLADAHIIEGGLSLEMSMKTENEDGAFALVESGPGGRDLDLEEGIDLLRVDESIGSNVEVGRGTPSDLMKPSKGPDAYDAKNSVQNSGGAKGQMTDIDAGRHSPPNHSNAVRFRDGSTPADQDSATPPEAGPVHALPIEAASSAVGGPETLEITISSLPNDGTAGNVEVSAAVIDAPHPQASAPLDAGIGGGDGDTDVASAPDAGALTPLSVHDLASSQSSPPISASNPQFQHGNSDMLGVDDIAELVMAGGSVPLPGIESVDFGEFIPATSDQSSDLVGLPAGLEALV